MAKTRPMAKRRCAMSNPDSGRVCNRPANHATDHAHRDVDGKIVEVWPKRCDETKADGIINVAIDKIERLQVETAVKQLRIDAKNFRRCSDDPRIRIEQGPEYADSLKTRAAMLDAVATRLERGF